MNKTLEGLPLFAWRPPACLVPFPPARRTAFVRATAQRSLAERDGKALKEAVAMLKLELAAVGLNDEQALQRIFEFHDAVLAEVARMDGRAPPRGCLR